MKKVAFYTLGCKVNSYESEAMAGQFAARGYEIVDPAGTADVYVINTCTVTAVGDKKSRQMIRRAKRKNPAAIIAVTGCYAQVAKDEVAAIDGVDIIVGNDAKAQIVNLVEEFSDRQISLVSAEPEGYEDFGAAGYHSHTRATIKIQDGCNSFCSYCIIPYARGRIRSRRISSILEEAASLAAQGFVEIVLVGIHLASYGLDLDGVTLADVVEQLNQIDGIKRIRLGSLEPKSITDEFVSRMMKVSKLCPHFHLSLQSGCDETLKRMNRKYLMKDYFEALERIRRIPDCAVTTDVMVGFAGETEEEFAENLSNVIKCGFSFVHIFPYSVRNGTLAAKMDNQVDEHTKALRAEIMLKETTKCKEAFMNKYIGRTMEVLFEQNGEGLTANYLRVRTKDGEGIKPVLITGIDGDLLVGECINETSD